MCWLFSEVFGGLLGTGADTGTCYVRATVVSLPGALGQEMVPLEGLLTSLLRRGHNEDDMRPERSRVPVCSYLSCLGTSALPSTPSALLGRTGELGRAGRPRQAGSPVSQLPCRETSPLWTMILASENARATWTEGGPAPVPLAVCGGSGAVRGDGPTSAPVLSWPKATPSVPQALPETCAPELYFINAFPA